MQLRLKHILYAALCLLFLFVTLHSSCKYQVVTQMPWNSDKSSNTSSVTFHHGDFNTLIDSAKANNISIFIDFYTTWCGPCKLMDKEVFTENRVAKVLNDGFINLKVDSEKGEGKKLRNLFNVKAYPTLVIIDSSGKEVFRHEGLLTSPRLLKTAKKWAS